LAGDTVLKTRCISYMRFLCHVLFAIVREADHARQISACVFRRPRFTEQFHAMETATAALVPPEDKDLVRSIGLAMDGAKARFPYAELTAVSLSHFPFTLYRSIGRWQSLLRTYRVGLTSQVHSRRSINQLYPILIREVECLIAHDARSMQHNCNSLAAFRRS
jgi:hypothetical protein